MVRQKRQKAQTSQAPAVPKRSKTHRTEDKTLLDPRQLAMNFPGVTKALIAKANDYLVSYD
jgi:hypothetical protein